MHEDLKLNKMRENMECPRIGRLIVKMILITDPGAKVSYIDYYLKEYGFLGSEYELELKNHFKGNSIISSINTEIEPLPKLYKWLE
jgi:hypothetical protein